MARARKVKPRPRTKSAALAKLVIHIPNHWFLPAETVWARRVARGQYAIANIPFFAYDLNLGDVVRARPCEDSLPEVFAVVRRSGNQTLRVIFKSTVTAKRRRAALARLETLSATFEAWDETYVAINVADPERFAAVEAALVALQRARVLSYETCEARVPGTFDGVPLVKPRAPRTGRNARS